MDELKELKFEPGAMSIVQMGEELIGHPSTAINELVKNAYDADADRCWVYTQYDKDPQKNFLIIKDNGLGMDSDTLFGDWLKPSISIKRDSDIDKRRSLIFERRFLGSKGIGRLASMALGQILTVVSKQKEDNGFNWLRLNRDIFKKGGLLNEITFPGGIVNDFNLLFSDEKYLNEFQLKPNGNLIHLLSSTPYNDFVEGTMIILQNLDDSLKTIIEEEVQVGDIQETAFFKSLRELITPLKLTVEIQKELVAEKILNEELKIDNGSSTFELLYGINFIQDQKKGDINFIQVESSPILNFYDYRVFGKVTSDSEVYGKYICKRFPKDNRDEEFKLDSEFLMSNELPNIRTVKDLEVARDNSNVGEFYFDFRIYDLDDDSKESMVKKLKASGRREATQIFSKYLGLKITKNGFGVKPYGEEGQDWLGLGAKRVNKHLVSVGPNQIIGYTFLYSPQNDGLNEKTNREGFFENKAFIIFKKILNSILEYTGRKRFAYRLSHNLGRNTNSKLIRPDSEKFIQYILSKTEDPSLIEKTREFIVETNTVLDNMQDSLTFSQRLASLGTGLELLFHELSQPITSIGGATNSLINNVKNIVDSELRMKLEKRCNTIKSSVEALDILKDSLRPAIGKSLPKEFYPAETFKKVCHLFENIFRENNIQLQIQQGALNKKIKDSEYVFWISFLNIVNNAVYWLCLSEKEKIIIFQYEDPNTFIISNTGPMISYNEEIDEIFAYGVTSKNERNATGLGLAFTRSLLSSIDWGVSAENMSYGPAFFMKSLK